MPSVIKPHDSPIWYASFRMPTGQLDARGRLVFNRVRRATGMTDRRRALQVAISFERAAVLVAERQWTEEAARQFLKEIDVLTGAPVLPSTSVEEFLASWMRAWKTTVVPKSWLNAKSVVRDFVEWLGNHRCEPMHSLSVRDIAGFRDAELAVGKAPTTINKELSFLAQAFDEAVAQGLVERNLVRGLRLKRAKHAAQSRLAFTFEQFCDLVRRTGPGERGTSGAETHPDWQTFLVVSGYTGGRQQEVAGLTWGRVDFAHRRIGLVRRKTGGDIHWIPMHDSLLAHLHERADAMPNRKETDFVMPGFAGVEGRYLSKAFRELILPRIGIRQPYLKHGAATRHGRKLAEYSIHSLRHSLPTWLNAAGVSDVMRMRIIGHEDAEVSRGYTHTDIEHAREALAKVPPLPTVEVSMVPVAAAPRSATA